MVDRLSVRASKADREDSPERMGQRDREDQVGSLGSPDKGCRFRVRV